MAKQSQQDSKFWIAFSEYALWFSIKRNFYPVCLLVHVPSLTSKYSVRLFESPEYAYFLEALTFQLFSLFLLFCSAKFKLFISVGISENLAERK